ncbi:alpha/beta fold hydrolase [Nitrosophilus alvini]|uniref:alpha/beta fold hydrolase n=1 Tax=Nitrosophilus alvini TaxID=2714855 RepID=UPI00190AE879|nr:alpha/beta hydrolase [Nitrosophilus alvini]
MAIKEISYKEKVFTISYDILNLQKEDDIVFLHGWGSNKKVMKSAFSKTLCEFRHIYVDMPGFGKSPNSEVLTTVDYANIIDIFLNKIGAKKDIVVGHSFGGKVALFLKPKLLVLLSTAGIKLPKSLKVRAKIALFKLLKPVGGAKIRRFFVSKDAKDMPQNMYETFKNVVDEDFAPLFEKYEGRTLVCWGKEDKATPLAAGEKIASLLRNCRFEVYEGDHYFFLKNSSIIAKSIEENYEKL